MLHKRPLLGINLEASVEMPSTDMLLRFDGSDSSVINNACSFGLIGIPCPDSCSVENEAFPIDNLDIQDNSSVLSTSRCSRFDISCVPEVVRSCMDSMTTWELRQDLIDTQAVMASLDAACVEFIKETENSRGGLILQVSL